MSATDGHTVMKFVHVQFDQNWQSGKIGEWGKEYRAIKDGAYIAMLDESKSTYWYKLNKGAAVWVSANHNTIFVPGWVTEPPKGEKTNILRARKRNMKNIEYVK